MIDDPKILIDIKIGSEIELQKVLCMTCIIILKFNELKLPRYNELSECPHQIGV